MNDKKVDDHDSIVDTVWHNPNKKPMPDLKKKKFQRRFLYSNGDLPLEGYTIKRGIGIGGFGEVYFAISDAGKEVALKRIQKNLDIELRGVKHCLNLKHINLISLWDIREDARGEGWVVMEYVPGRILREIIDQHPFGLQEDMVRRWFCGAASGVAYLHQNGIVHRDLKPGNIFNDEAQDVVKIGDYGLSKFLANAGSGQTERVGTFHYMAPEIGNGSYGKGIDIYALGIILFEMLTGKVPYDGESSQEIIMKHLTDAPNLSSIEKPYRSVIKKALAKDPDRRYQTVEEMIEALGFVDNSRNSFRAPKKTDTIEPDDIEIVGNAKVSNTRVPPIRPMLLNDVKSDPDPLYISDDEDQEMVFGEVQEVVPAQPSDPLPVAQLVTPQSNSAYVGQPVPPPGSVHPNSVHPNSVHPNSVHPNSASVATPQQDRLAQRESAEAAPLPTSYIEVEGEKTRFQIVQSWWGQGLSSTLIKLMILAGLSLLMLVFPEAIIPICSVLGVLILSYYGIASFNRVALPKGERKKIERLNQQIGIRNVRESIKNESMADRFSELIGSWIGASVFAITISLLGMLAFENPLEASAKVWAYHTWLAATSICAAWGILALSKMWETSDGIQLARRFATMVVGLVLAMITVAIYQILLVDSQLFPVPSNMTDAVGTPDTAIFLILFGVLFSALRWWKQSDPARGTRFSLRVIGLSTVLAVLLGLILQVPLQWAILFAVSVSASVQLAAPWIHPKQRNQVQPRTVEN